MGRKQIKKRDHHLFLRISTSLTDVNPFCLPTSPSDDSFAPLFLNAPPFF